VATDTGRFIQGRTLRRLSTRRPIIINLSTD